MLNTFVIKPLDHPNALKMHQKTQTENINSSHVCTIQSVHDAMNEKAQKYNSSFLSNRCGWAAFIGSETVRLSEYGVCKKDFDLVSSLESEPKFRKTINLIPSYFTFLRKAISSLLLLSKWERMENKTDVIIHVDVIHNMRSMRIYWIMKVFHLLCLRSILSRNSSDPIDNKFILHFPP